MGLLFVFESGKDLEQIATSEEAINRGLIPDDIPIVEISERKKSFKIRDHFIDCGENVDVVRISYDHIPKNAVAYVRGLMMTPGFTVKAGFGFIPMQYYKKIEVQKE